MEFIMPLLPFIAIILVMYFLMIRPAQKKQREVQEMQESLQKGDDIITIGGVHGRVESFDQKHMYILTDDQGTVLKFERVALKEVVK
ncbi:preprotein translocase subunit YajC [Lacicoccus alkaliphilus]|uniref:Preprotein translocase subunit YajC n=2 Tax=Lacicoccus TaxID=3076172 RepID=A0A1M7BTP9_9BACL|nr:preprotein translocase subunit YajC [Salinicoccus alkaliphilus]SHL57949.1 preprotein translocase subunit YajC [Salinicoccus alkaliphilus DSM 16010]